MSQKVRGDFYFVGDHGRPRNRTPVFVVTHDMTGSPQSPCRLSTSPTGRDRRSSVSGLGVSWKTQNSLSLRLVVTKFFSTQRTVRCVQSRPHPRLGSRRSVRPTPTRGQCGVPVEKVSRPTSQRSIPTPPRAKDGPLNTDSPLCRGTVTTRRPLRSSLFLAKETHSQTPLRGPPGNRRPPDHGGPPKATSSRFQSRVARPTGRLLSTGVCTVRFVESTGSLRPVGAQQGSVDLVETPVVGGRPKGAVSRLSDDPSFRGDSPPLVVPSGSFPSPSTESPFPVLRHRESHSGVSGRTPSTPRVSVGPETDVRTLILSSGELRLPGQTNDSSCQVIPGAVRLGVLRLTSCKPGPVPSLRQSPVGVVGLLGAGRFRRTLRARSVPSVSCVVSDAGGSATSHPRVRVGVGCEGFVRMRPPAVGPGRAVGASCARGSSSTRPLPFVQALRGPERVLSSPVRRRGRGERTVPGATGH